MLWASQPQRTTSGLKTTVPVPPFPVKHAGYYPRLQIIGVHTYCFLQLKEFSTDGWMPDGREWQLVYKYMAQDVCLFFAYVNCRMLWTTCWHQDSTRASCPSGQRGPGCSLWIGWRRRGSVTQSSTARLSRITTGKYGKYLSSSSMDSPASSAWRLHHLGGGGGSAICILFYFYEWLAHSSKLVGENGLFKVGKVWEFSSQVSCVNSVLYMHSSRLVCIHISSFGNFSCEVWVRPARKQVLAIVHGYPS